MPDLTIPNIPDSVLTGLATLADQAGCSVEEYAKKVVSDAVAGFWREEGNDLSFSQLQANMDAILHIAERKPVFLTDEDGQRFVLLSMSEFDRITQRKKRRIDSSARQTR